MRAYDLPVPGIPHLYTHLPKTPRTEPGKNELHYCQRTTASGLLPAGMPFTSSGSRTEFAWKYDIKLGCKALRLKATQAHPIENVHLGKLAVVKASNRSEEHTSELQSRLHLVCRLLLE